ncbi:hypothetical protein RclHR1_01290002 [Rhizophagus clarus]|uniref:Protein kinase domain-containing protein n=1 Tax=Rhizophagus clarus TaxID=94130 RepID=A0A2Z6R0T8_9GLOM|nr:hypothetical protein RclHR1_01290002 [Rhizophagus clarus]
MCYYIKTKIYISLYFYLNLEFGESENAILNKFILEKNLKWIPYNKFKDVEHLDEGGFSTVYKAIWINENKNKNVVLKCPNENIDEILNEWKYHENCLHLDEIIYLYGFTKNQDTHKYMMVMDYANEGNLRRNLTKIIKNNWIQKLNILYQIISGLNNIHNQNFIHCDFHDGNILNHGKGKVYISDLGLCQPAKSLLKKKGIYGVIPFMAPEVLRGKSYTPASDIYSFSMIMWEFTSGIPPFNNKAHDLQLSLSICRGERPEIIENTPPCYVDLMKKCWNEDPSKRPSASEVESIIRNWVYYSPYDINAKELKSNIMEFINAPIEHKNLAAKSHPQAHYTSRILDFTSEKLNEILKSESKNLDECMIKSF